LSKGRDLALKIKMCCKEIKKLAHKIERSRTTTQKEKGAKEHT
jgi:hypothetical protein